jgi:hypothetical protein
MRMLRVPRWMSVIHTLTSVKALGLGFLLSAVNPKNLIMAAGAGVAIGAGDLVIAQVAVLIAFYAAAAAATVAVPVVAYPMAGRPDGGARSSSYASGWSARTPW